MSDDLVQAIGVRPTAAATAGSRSAWRRVAHDAAVLLGSGVVLAILQAAFRGVSISAVSVDTYGRAALLLSVFNTVSVVGRFGLPAATARLSVRSHGREHDLAILRAVGLASLAPVALSSLAMALASWLVTASWTMTVLGGLGVAPLLVAGYCYGFIRGKGSVWIASSILPINIGTQLLVLVALVAGGVHVGVDWIMGSYYIGNVVALLLGMASVLAVIGDENRKDLADPEATPQRIFAFSMWLSIAQGAVIALGLIPRISLAHGSYAELAYFDLALLIYTLPQRLKSSFVLALIPVATVEADRGSKMKVPSGSDLVVMTAAIAAVDALLWVTHAIRHLFLLIGLSRYVSAEPLLLIILLAFPAELFYGLISGMLQAAGNSRRLARAAVIVFAASAASAQLGYVFGPLYLAFVLVASYWLLYMTTRHALLTSGAEESNMLLPIMKRRLTPLLRAVTKDEALRTGAIATDEQAAASSDLPVSAAQNPPDRSVVT